MATHVLDAFLITFGIDARGYKSGERDIRRSFKDVREEAKGTFDDVERRGKNASQTFRTMRNEVAGLFLFLAGANSLKDFASNLLTGTANADRFGETLGMSAGRVIAWETVVKGVGGSAQEADSALQAMQNTISKFMLTGQPDAGLRAFGITAGDLSRNDPEFLLTKLADARGKFSAQEYAARLQQLGLPQNVIYLLERGSKSLRTQVDDAERHANVTKRDADAAEQFQKKLADLETTVSGKVRPALTVIVEWLDKFLNDADSANVIIPLVAGGMAALGLAAISALGPWGILAAVIAAVLVGLNKLIEANPKVKGALDTLESPLRKWLGPIIGDWWFQRPGEGDAPGGSGGAPGAAKPGSLRSFADSQIAAIGATGGGQPNTRTGRYIESKLIAGGLTPEVARGVTAALHAESGLDANARNPNSGAFGISQWLGSRKTKLFRRYGRNPSLDNQIQFLLWELMVGDHGGGAVRSARSSGAALTAMVASFLRPQGKNWERMGDYYGDIRRGQSYLRSSGNVSINSITINTRATDAQGIARSIGPELKKRRLISGTAAGLNP